MCQTLLGAAVADWSYKFRVLWGQRTNDLNLFTDIGNRMDFSLFLNNPETSKLTGVG